MPLDLPTLVALTALSALLMGASIFLAGHTQHSSDPAMSRLGCACLVQSLGWLLVRLRGQIPDALSVVGGNAALVWASLFYLFAVNVFLDGAAKNGRGSHFPHLKLAHNTLLAIGFLYAATLIYFSFPMPSIAARIVSSALFQTLIYALCAARLLQRRELPTGAEPSTGVEPSTGAGLPKSQRLVGWGFLFGGALQVFRVLMVALNPPPTQELFSALASQFGAPLFAHAAVVMLTFLFVLMVHDRTARELRELVTHDYLTGVFNRSAFEGFSRQNIEQARRSGESLALLLFDVDNFKGINDTLGHLTGDVALRSLADLTAQLLRSQDVFGRYGGEEFAVLLPATDAEGARLVAERIRESVAQNEFRDGAASFPLTISIGIAELGAGEKISTEERLTALFRAADAALYAAKRAGRNRTLIAAPETETPPVKAQSSF